MACPVSVSGPIGTAASFDGTDDVLIGAAIPTTSFEDGFSVAVFVQDLSQGTQSRMYIGKPLGPGILNSFGLAVFDFSSANVVAVLSEPMAMGTTNVLDTQVLPAPQWHHLALTWDGATARAYVDGEPSGSLDVPAVGFDDSPLLVGADNNTGALAYFLTGGIDEVRIYDRPLSDTEVSALAASVP
jgi:hypothetical protein